MKEYHKIQTVFKRDPETKFRTLLMGDWSEPEFGYLANNEWVFTEKVDGTNIRVMFNAAPVLDTHVPKLSFGGKTDNAQIPAFLVDRLRQRFEPQMDRLFEIFPEGGCLYGEGYGARIQKGGDNYRPDADFVLFDVKVGEWWLQRSDIEDVAGKLGLDVVPVIGTGTLPEMVAIASEGFNSSWGAFRAEGIVARPSVEFRSRNGGRIITKIKYRDFP